MKLTSTLLLGLIFKGIICTDVFEDKVLFDTLVFEQQWPVCKDTTDCPFSNIDGARFVTDAVFAMNSSIGLPIKNCISRHHRKLDLGKLAGIADDLDFAWPNWPKKLFKQETALEEEWDKYASCFMDYMKDRKLFMDEEEFFAQVISWYTEFQFAEQLKQYRILPGSIVYIDRLYHGLRATTGRRGQPRIDCKAAKNQDGQVEVEWRKVALCFNITTLEPVDCGNLYGGYNGSCPKFFSITYPYPLPKPSNKSDTRGITFNFTYNYQAYQRETMIMTMLFVLVICFILYVYLK